jgi:HSP20 family protein
VYPRGVIRSGNTLVNIAQTVCRQPLARGRQPRRPRSNAFTAPTNWHFRCSISKRNGGIAMATQQPQQEPKDQKRETEQKEQKKSATSTKSDEAEKKPETVPVKRTTEAPAAAQRGARGWAPRSLARRLRRPWMSPTELLAESPFELVRRMSDDFDRLFGIAGFLDDDFIEPIADAQAWAPQIDVFERDGDLVVRADLPGMKKDDVKVEVRDDRLVIEGERRQQAERREGGYYRTERSYGEFRRVIPLPEGIESDAATASFDDGVLEVRMKQNKREGKRIEITSSEKPEVH